MKITTQDYIILSILDCLDDTIQGQGIKMQCHIEYQLEENQSFIILIRKDGKPMDTRDAFWLGYLTREFV